MGSRSRDRARRSPAEWRKILSRFERSRLSIEAFCQRESLSKSSFVRWRSKLTSDPEPFVELTVPTEPASDSSAWAVELELPGQIVLRVRGA